MTGARSQAGPVVDSPDNSPDDAPGTLLAHAVLEWFDQHGRKDLPWQQDITPYRVWVSEIMLQQTQVKTVIPYFERFLLHFPTVKALAAATEDEVLHLWTGLGYYSRARNLRRSAIQIVNDHRGAMPDTLNGLQQLPGIGRSTAGAILAIAHRQRAAILDGNVKRVLARYHAVSGWPGQSAVNKRLWQYAEHYTPGKRVHHYTQAMMDLGATVCTRSKPDCPHCPLYAGCQGRQSGQATDYPGRKPKKVLPLRHTRMLIIENQHGEVLLRKRPPDGIWSSLWLFPEIAEHNDPAQYCQDTLHSKPERIERWPDYLHTFSHYKLLIQPTYMHLHSATGHVSENERSIWYNRNSPQKVGLAAPVVKLLQQLDTPSRQTTLSLQTSPSEHGETT